RNWDREQSASDYLGLATAQDPVCIGRGRAVGLVNPHARVEMAGVAVGARDVVAMREQNIADAAELFEPLHELVDIARRIDEQVAIVGPGQEGMRGEGGGG